MTDFAIIPPEDIAAAVERVEQRHARAAELERVTVELERARADLEQVRSWIAAQGGYPEERLSPAYLARQLAQLLGWGSAAGTRDPGRHARGGHG